MKKTKFEARADHYLDLMDTSPKFGWVVGLFIMAVSFIPKFSHDLNSDSTVYLYLAGRMLDGAKYYTDFFEFNTPFAIGIYAIPVALARVFGIFVPIAGKIFIGLLIIGSIYYSHTIIRQSKEWKSTTKYNAIIISLFFAFNFLSNFYDNELTTKSIVFLCCILPYFFSIQLHLEKVATSRNQQIAIGILLGLALCLKPHYIIFPAVMEIYLACKRRGVSSLFRWLNILAGAVALVYYVVIIPLFFPGYIKIIPFFFEYYDAAYATMRDKISEIFIYVLYWFPFLLWRSALKDQLNSLVLFEIFFAGIAASTAILFTETLLSSDQRSILNFFIVIPFLYSILVFLRHGNATGVTVNTKQKCLALFAVIIGSVTVFGLVNVLSAYNPALQSRERTTMSMLDYVNKYAPNEPVYTISENTEHFSPLMMYLSKRPYPIFHLQRMVRNLERQHYTYRNANLPKRTMEAEHYLMEALNSFFTTTPPKLVFISEYSRMDRDGYCLPSSLDIIIRRNYEFRALWEKRYKKIGTIITTKEIRWLEDTPARKVKLDFGSKKVYASFPSEEPLRSWLDVYVRKD